MLIPSSPPVAGPHRAPPTDLAAIAAAATELFARNGYRATTMADIGAAVGMRGPSLYRHVHGKQDLLVASIESTMRALLAAQQAATAAGGSPTVRVRRMVEAHVRFHGANRSAAFVGNRELDNLAATNRQLVLGLRTRYEHGLRDVIDEGRRSGEFHVLDSRLASFAILDMGIGVSTWFRGDGPADIETVAYAHADFAMAMLGSTAVPGSTIAANAGAQASSRKRPTRFRPPTVPPSKRSDR